MALDLSTISSVTATTGTGYLTPADSLSDIYEPGAPGQGANPAGASAFADALGGVVDNTQRLQATSNELAIAAVTGDLQDIHDATLASTRAQTTLEVVSAVRNKAVNAFNEIMRMQA